MAQTEERMTKNRVVIPLVFVFTFLVVGVTAITLQSTSGQLSGTFFNDIWGILFHVAILIWAAIFVIWATYKDTNTEKKVQPRWRGMFINLIPITVLLCCVTFIIYGPHQNQVVTDSNGKILDFGPSSRFGISIINPFTEKLYSYPDEFSLILWNWNGADSAYILFEITEDGKMMYLNWGPPAQMKDSVFTLFCSVWGEYRKTHSDSGLRVVVNKTFDNLPDMPGIRPVDIITHRTKHAF